MCITTKFNQPVQHPLSNDTLLCKDVSSIVMDFLHGPKQIWRGKYDFVMNEIKISGVDVLNRPKKFNVVKYLEQFFIDNTYHTLNVMLSMNEFLERMYLTLTEKLTFKKHVNILSKYIRNSSWKFVSLGEWNPIPIRFNGNTIIITNIKLRYILGGFDYKEYKCVNGIIIKNIPKYYRMDWGDNIIQRKKMNINKEIKNTKREGKERTGTKDV